MSNCEDEPQECPLCMEPFDLDDISFFPCTCGYQICRFCWHRIRTNENGLCPACRKSYPEDPAEFKPLTDDEVHKIKKDRRQKENQRKQKSAESRKHLANVRVVQKNLVFVVGLSHRLTDPEVLKRHEYFGKFGKIHKVVINQSTSYVGSQGPSSSAYVTYYRTEDALNAIRAVNNLQTEGRTLKASLGTTKYCSHFLKGTQCLKTDCMYLHDLGDEKASFTKEEIQAGKHLRYEQKLYEQYTGTPAPTSSSPDPIKSQASKGKDDSPPSGSRQSSVSNGSATASPSRQPAAGLAAAHEFNPASNADFAQAVLAASKAQDELCDKQAAAEIAAEQAAAAVASAATANGPTLPTAHSLGNLHALLPPGYGGPAGSMVAVGGGIGNGVAPAVITRPSPFSTPAEHLSLFSASGFPSSRNPKPIQQPLAEEHVPPATEIPDTIPVNSSTDWQEAFGFTSSSADSHDDDLGFDPWDESAKALADLIETEKFSNYRAPQQIFQPPNGLSMPRPSNHIPFGMFGAGCRPKMMPPGFAPPNGYTAHTPYLGDPALLPRSKMLNLMQGPPARPPHPLEHGFHNMRDPYLNHTGAMLKPDVQNFTARQTNTDVFSMRDWQEGLKALLPNINISFGAPTTLSAPTRPTTGYNGNTASSPHNSTGLRPPPTHPNYQFDRNWSSQSLPDLAWDPAIVNTGGIAVPSADNGTADDTPHWMASLHHLTEEVGPHPGLATSPVPPPTFMQRHMPAAHHPMSSWMHHQGVVKHPPPGFTMPPAPRPNHIVDGPAAQLPAS